MVFQNKMSTFKGELCFVFVFYLKQEVKYELTGSKQERREQWRQIISRVHIESDGGQHRSPKLPSQTLLLPHDLGQEVSGDVRGQR